MVAIDFGTTNTALAAYSEKGIVARGFAGPRRPSLLEELRELVNSHPALGQVAKSALTVGSSSPLSLDDALSVDMVDSRRLDALIAELERYANDRQAEDIWLALQRCYRGYFDAPPFESLGIWPVSPELAGDEQVLPSAVAETPEGQVLVGVEYLRELDELIDLAVHGTNGSGPRPEPVPSELTIHRGLKRRIGTQHADEAERLVERFLRRVKGGIEDEFEKNPRFTQSQLEPMVLRRAVLTYPTVAHPGRRRRIKEIAQAAGIEEVVGYYDEAVAAAIAYLAKVMRGNFEIGFEQFLSRCRQKDAGRWAHNALIVDVGGGTTDVALLAIDIEDCTGEHQHGQEDISSWGRLYRVTPTVLGSSGAMFHGGDRLTLDLFRYRKAREAMAGGRITNLERPDDYVIRVSSLEEQTRSLRENLMAEVDARVPTRWQQVDDGTERAQRQAAFYRRWRDAEDAKIDYARGDYDGDEDERRFLKASVERFAESVGKLAGDLVSVHLDDDQCVDAVVLSGKSSGFPAVRDRLISELRAHGVDQSSIVTYDDDNARKHAASFGACYAQHLYEKGFPDPRLSLQMGSWQLDLEVRNLRFNLPATFTMRPQAGATEPIPLFGGRPGEREFRPIDEKQLEEEQACVRSSWYPMQPTVFVHRQPTPDDVIWGSWDFPALLGEHYAALKSRLRGQFEVDLDLSLRLHLTNDRAALDLRRETLVARIEDKVAADGDEVAVPPEPGERAAGRDLLTLVPSISVVHGQSSGLGNMRAVPVASSGKVFAHLAVVDDGNPIEALVVPLDDGNVHTATRDGELVVSFEFPGESRAKSVKVPAADTRTVEDRILQVNERYRPVAHLVLTRDGRLYYSSGYPPYWATDDIADLSTPGKVYTMRATDPPDEPEMEVQDPFNGRH
jgi:molecular chaperone DnaK (HSP70)